MDWDNQQVYAADERITAHLAEDTVDKSDLSTDEYIEWIAEEILKELKNEEEWNPRLDSSKMKGKWQLLKTA